MKKRFAITVLVMLVIVAVLGLVKAQQVKAAIAQGASFQPPPEAVTTIVAANAQWPATLKAIASVAAVQGVTVSADLSGIVERITFDSGRSVRQGEVLVQLDTSQERAQLAAAEAQRDLAKVNFSRVEALVAEGAIARAEYDRAAAEKRQTEARVGEIRATIARKTIKAPFSGVLGIRQVNLGQFVSGGDPIVPLQSLDPIYVNFSVPQQVASKVRVGQKLNITTSDFAGKRFIGRVTAIDSVVDEATRNVRVQATLANPSGTLRPGMFVESELNLGNSQSVVTVPASAISYAPYGDSVYVVSDMKDKEGKLYRGVRQQFVKVDRSRGDQVAVLSGVNHGDEVVTSGVFKLRNGAAVQVNNNVQPSNNPAPKPEDN